MRYKKKKSKIRKTFIVLFLVIEGIFLWSWSNNLVEKSRLLVDGSNIEREKSIEAISEILKVRQGNLEKTGFLGQQFEAGWLANSISEKNAILAQEEQEIHYAYDIIYDTNPEFTPVNYESSAFLQLTEDYGKEYIDKISFICDSPTYWLWPNNLLTDGEDSNQIWTGPEGTMTLAYQSTYNILDPYDNVEKPIREVIALHQPEYLFIALGVNGISFMDEVYFKEEYSDLVLDAKELSPDTVIIFQSIFPITRDFIYWGDITNVMISEANSWILEMAEDMDCKYLDAFSIYFDEEGYVNKELYRVDGLHPNFDGLKLLLQYIRTHGYAKSG